MPQIRLQSMGIDDPLEDHGVFQEPSTTLSVAGRGDDPQGAPSLDAAWTGGSACWRAEPFANGGLRRGE